MRHLRETFGIRRIKSRNTAWFRFKNRRKLLYVFWPWAENREMRHLRETFGICRIKSRNIARFRVEISLKLLILAWKKGLGFVGNYTVHSVHTAPPVSRARIFKRLWSPGIDSKEWIPPGLCILAGRYDSPIPTRCLAPIDFFKIPALGKETPGKIPSNQRSSAWGNWRP